MTKLEFIKSLENLLKEYNRLYDENRCLALAVKSKGEWCENCKNKSCILFK